MTALEEAQFVESFVKPSLRARWLYMLDSPKKRSKQLQRLFHGFDFEASIIEEFKGHAAKQGELISSLIKRGAGGAVHVISANPLLDGKVFRFKEAIANDRHDEGCAWAPASICIYEPKRLAVFANEYDHFLLFNP
jgi:hypothetical protein